MNKALSFRDRSITQFRIRRYSVRTNSTPQSKVESAEGRKRKLNDRVLRIINSFIIWCNWVYVVNTITTFYWICVLRIVENSYASTRIYFRRILVSSNCSSFSFIRSYFSPYYKLKVESYTKLDTQISKSTPGRFLVFFSVAFEMSSSGWARAARKRFYCEGWHIFWYVQL